MQSISENNSFLSNNFVENTHGGAIAPLDLFNGHLSTSDGTHDDIPLQLTRFVHLHHNGRDIPGWFQSHDAEYNPWPFVAKIQPFVSGGYEVTITKVELDKIGRAMDGGLRTGKREKGVQNENDIASSILRSKKRVRHLIKSMGCDRLLTLTRREGDSEEFWGVEQWAAAWKRFRRLCDKAGIDLLYVAVMERHKKGNYHMHAAIVGNINVKTIRRFWFICCGGRGNEKGSDTPGNVDISFRADLPQSKRLSGCSKYCSKYISKQAGMIEFNKKRYWSSHHELPPAIRHILKYDHIKGCLFELAVMLGLDVYKCLNGKAVFIFPNEFGCWFNFDESLLAPPPF